MIFSVTIFRALMVLLCLAILAGLAGCAMSGRSEQPVTAPRTEPSSDVAGPVADKSVSDPTAEAIGDWAAEIDDWQVIVPMPGADGGLEIWLVNEKTNETVILHKEAWREFLRPLPGAEPHWTADEKKRLLQAYLEHRQRSSDWE